MLVIAFFKDTRSILVDVADVLPEGSPLLALEAHQRLHNALRAAGYEETPVSFGALGYGIDLVVGEVETASLVDLIAASDEFAGDEGAPEAMKLAEDLDATGVWAPVICEPLATMIEDLEAETFPETTEPTEPPAGG